MKSIAALCFLVLFNIFSSCSDTNDKNTNTNIKGVWNLRNVNGSITGASYDFEPGVVTWNFNTTTNLVTVINNNTNNNLNAVLSSGVYSYSIISSTNSTSSCSQTIRIDNQEMGCLTVTATDLIMSQTFADGIGIQLKR